MKPHICALRFKGASITALWALLRNGDERSVDELFDALRRGAVDGKRARQQRVGAIISRINYRIAPFGVAVLPGEARGTYRLVQRADG